MMVKVLEASLVTQATRKLNLIFRTRWENRNETFPSNLLMTKQVFLFVMDGILIKFIIKTVSLTCIFINDICPLYMSSNCFDAGLVRSQLLEKCVICLKISGSIR